MAFYTPTEEQKKQAEKAIGQANLAIGRFVTAWSRVDAHLRTLELMHVGKRCFRPVENLASVDLKKNRRFAERVKLVVPKQIEGERFVIHDWLLETAKVRNLILHGRMDFYGKTGSNILTPVIIHTDFTSTLAASKGFPNVTAAHVPLYKNSLKADTVIRLDKLEILIDEAKHVETVLRKVIEFTHKHGFFGTQSASSSKVSSSI